jgi:hypothetical protein
LAYRWKTGDGYQPFYAVDYLITTGDIFSINVSMLHTEHQLRQIDKKAAASFTVQDKRIMMRNLGGRNSSINVG